jgi:hypothetical protein
MFKLDDNLLQELGLGTLPAHEKNKMLGHIYETLEMRVGMKLAEQMSNEQLDEFESYIDRNDEPGALKWLETNFPNYKDVVAGELDKLKVEVKTAAPQIVAASMADPANQAAMQAPQAAPAGQMPAQPATQAAPQAMPMQQQMPASMPQQVPQMPMQPQMPAAMPAPTPAMPAAPIQDFAMPAPTPPAAQPMAMPGYQPFVPTQQPPIDPMQPPAQMPPAAPTA